MSLPPKSRPNQWDYSYLFYRPRYLLVWEVMVKSLRQLILLKHALQGSVVSILPELISTNFSLIKGIVANDPLLKILLAYKVDGRRVPFVWRIPFGSSVKEVF